MLEELNEEQRKAATTINGPVRIIAGAGTGKTKTLVSRVAYMLQQEIPAEHIMLLTFTNKAANEMKQRVTKSVGAEKSQKLTACTFHSFCHRFLRIYAKYIGFENNFAIMTDGDCLDVISDLSEPVKKKLKEEGKEIKRFPKDRTILALNGESIGDMKSIRDTVMFSKCCEGFVDEVIGIIQGYAKFKKEHNLMDYDDLLYFTVKFLHENESVRAAADKKYQYIMVDEYQDTNLIQDEFLKLLTRDYRNIAVVGDDNQSIYRFRGAHIENILQFKKKYPDCEDVFLVRNYRSTQQILDLSNRIMGHAVEGIQKDLVALKNDIRPEIVLTDTTMDEISQIVKYIKSYQKAGIALKDMAVIIRYGNTSYSLEAALNKGKIPYQKYGGQKFTEKEHVRNILSYLRASVSEHDVLAWMRILKQIPGIGQVAAKEIAGDIYNEGTGVLCGMKYMQKKYCHDLYTLYDILDEVKKMEPQEQILYLAETYYAPMKKRSILDSKKKDRDKAEAVGYLDASRKDFRLLADIADSYKSVREFLDDLVLNVSDPKKEEDALNITTIHSAKGLEYKVVFLMDPVQGIFPRTEDESDPENREDLRCLYVAVTRAKQRLHIFVSKESRGNGEIARLSMHLNYPDVLEVCDYPSDLADICDDIGDSSMTWDFR